MTIKPLVTVVIPVYNGAKYLKETLQSVVAQTYARMEVIAIDDGSTDGSEAVIGEFADVLCLRKGNGGQASARNAGIRAARGDYIAFVDQDDLWYPGKIDRQIKALNAERNRWVYSDCFYFYDGEMPRTYYRASSSCRMLGGDILEELLLDNFIYSPTAVVEKSVFEEIGYFDESVGLRNREDWDMWLRIAAKYPVSFVPEPTAAYRDHNSGESKTELIERAFEGVSLCIKLALQRQPDRLLRHAKHAMANAKLRTALQYTKIGNWPRARTIALESVRLRPLGVRAWMLMMALILGPKAVEAVRILRRRALKK